MNYSNLMEAVNARIKANGKREITGDILNDVLRAMVVELGAGYQLGGTIRPGDKPKDEDLRVAYLAVEPGMYLYAGGFEVTELSLITYGAEWYMYPLGVPFGSQIAEDIDAAVEAEKTRAMAAEEALSDEIDTEKTERSAVDSALDSAIKAEAKRATDAEGVLTKAVEDEKARAMAAEGANAAAIASEADAREQADATLQGNITAEETARKAADATLQTNINTEESERKAADTALGTRVTNIEDKIPAQATAENKLADKDFVNSSIATSTATFRGTFETLEALKAAQADKNDYAFWVHKDEDGNTCYDKYTYTGTEWKFEYRLNNSSFTAAQWAALNSGVTADVIKALQDADKANAKAIADEKAARIAAISAEQQAREQADTANAEAITAETAERKAADQTLQDNIDKKIFYVDYSEAPEGGYSSNVKGIDVKNAVASKNLILLRRDDGLVSYPTTVYIDINSVDIYYNDGPNDEGLWFCIEFIWNDLNSHPDIINYENLIWSDKQDKLVSGTNIKTINGESVLGAGDLKVSGGLPTIQAGTGANAEVFNGIAPASASGEKSHAEGAFTTASGGSGAHAEGNSTKAIGDSSHAEGFATTAIGQNSHAEGSETTANGFGSHAEGYQTTADGPNSHAEGTDNVPDSAAIHQVGIGEEDAPKDAHRITYDGKHYIIGIGGFDGTKATANLTNEKDLATVINEYETRIAALETALAGIK